MGSANGQAPEPGQTRVVAIRRLFDRHHAWRWIRRRCNRLAQWLQSWSGPGGEQFWLAATAALVLAGVALVLTGCPRRAEPVPTLSRSGASAPQSSPPPRWSPAPPQVPPLPAAGPGRPGTPLSPAGSSSTAPDREAAPGDEQPPPAAAAAQSSRPGDAPSPGSGGSIVRPPGVAPGAGLGTGTPTPTPTVPQTPSGPTPAEKTAKPALSSAQPRLAVVIDDWGYGWAATAQILALPWPLTAAVLPFAPYSREQARQAAAAGFQVILHLPMQPLADLPLPALAVRVNATDAEIRQELALALRDVPEAVGVSNHEGSRATADRRVMEAVLGEVRQRGLFFLDSRTGPASVVTQVAEELATPVLENTLFIDNVDSVYTIMARLRQGAEIARRRGQAIVIGHVRAATAQALELMLPELAQEGIELVHVSDLLPATGSSLPVVE